MKKYLSPTRIVFALALVACTICISSFRQKKQAGSHSFRTPTHEDTTTPGKRDRNAHEFRMDRLNQAMKQLDAEMEQLDVRLKQLDAVKLQKEIEASLSKVDAEKISKEVEASIKTIDWNKIEGDIKQSMQQLTAANIDQVKAAVEKAKAAMSNSKVQAHLNNKDLNENVQKAMTKARAAIEKARIELENTEAFTTALENDGLIDKTKPYRIEVKDGLLYLNGDRQSKETSEKYRKYFKKENFSIIRSDKDEDDRI